jgi:hypothetical protein
MRTVVSLQQKWCKVRPSPYLETFGFLYATVKQLFAAAARQDAPVPASAHEASAGPASLSSGGRSPQGGLCVCQEGGSGLINLTPLLGALPGDLQG